jgi:hypothetical protein
MDAKSKENMVMWIKARILLPNMPFQHWLGLYNGHAIMHLGLL